MHDRENQTIYEKAIKEVVRENKDDGPIYILDQAHISNFFWREKLEGLQYNGLA